MKEEQILDLLKETNQTEISDELKNNVRTMLFK